MKSNISDAELKKIIQVAFNKGRCSAFLQSADRCRNIGEFGHDGYGTYYKMAAYDCSAALKSYALDELPNGSIDILPNEYDNGWADCSSHYEKNLI